MLSHMMHTYNQFHTIITVIQSTIINVHHASCPHCMVHVFSDNAHLWLAISASTANHSNSMNIYYYK